MEFYVKDVLLVGVGQVFVAGVLCQVILVAEKRAHAPKLQDTLAAARRKAVPIRQIRHHKTPQLQVSFGRESQERL